MILQMIEERAAAGVIVQRPAERVLDEPGLVLFRRDLPEFLEPDPELRRLATFRKLEAGNELLGQGAAHTLAEQRVFSAQLHATRVAVFVVTILRDAHVAGGDAGDFAIGSDEHLCGREAGIDLDTEPLRLCRQPAADVAERNDEVAVVRHQRWHEKIGHAQRTGRPEPIKAIVNDLRLDRRVGLHAPLGQERVEADRIDHRAGKDVRPDFRSLLHDNDGELGVELLQANRSGEPGGSRAHDYDIELHRFARGKFLGRHRCPSGPHRGRRRGLRSTSRPPNAIF